jgi:hypothetical protein
MHAICNPPPPTTACLHHSATCVCARLCAGGKTLYVADTTDLPAGLTFTVGPVTFNDHRVSLALTTTSITISREDTLSELLCVAALSAFVFVCCFASCVCVSSCCWNQEAHTLALCLSTQPQKALVPFCCTLRMHAHVHACRCAHPLSTNCAHPCSFHGPFPRSLLCVTLHAQVHVVLPRGTRSVHTPPEQVSRPTRCSRVQRGARPGVTLGLG